MTSLTLAGLRGKKRSQGSAAGSADGGARGDFELMTSRWHACEPYVFFIAWNTSSALQRGTDIVH